MIKLKDLLKEDIGTKAYLGGIVQALRKAGIKYKKAQEIKPQYMNRKSDLGFFITVDDGIFQIGDCVSIFNDTGGNITITQGSGVTLRLVATSTTGSRTLATYGLATLLCVGGDAGGGNEFVVSGGGVS